MGIFDKLFKRKKTEKALYEEASPALPEEVIPEMDYALIRTIRASGLNDEQILHSDFDEVQSLREAAAMLLETYQGKTFVIYYSDMPSGGARNTAQYLRMLFLHAGKKTEIIPASWLTLEFQSHTSDEYLRKNAKESFGERCAVFITHEHNISRYARVQFNLSKSFRPAKGITSQGKLI